MKKTEFVHRLMDMGFEFGSKHAKTAMFKFGHGIGSEFIRVETERDWTDFGTLQISVHVYDPHPYAITFFTYFGALKWVKRNHKYLDYPIGV